MKSLHFSFALEAIFKQTHGQAHRLVHVSLILIIYLMLLFNQYHTSHKNIVFNKRVHINKCKDLDQLYKPYEQSCIKGMYGSRAVTLLVLIFDDVINWIPKPYIHTDKYFGIFGKWPVKFIRRGILTSRMW